MTWDDEPTPHQFGFTWGLFDVTRLTRIEGRGALLGVVVTTGRKTQREVQVYASETGRSVRVFVDGVEWQGGVQ